MCGISGYYLTPGHPADLTSKLDASLALLAHRGPDNLGLFSDPINRVGLAHSRLSVVELSNAANQPMISDDLSVALIFNGEIYNFRELRKNLSLEFPNIIWHSNSDTEVLLHLYLKSRENGIDFGSLLREINGIFAFALWDANLRQLILARDSMGVKPLYYNLTSKTFTFASEIKALVPIMEGLHFLPREFRGNSLSKKICPSSIDRYLSYLWAPGLETALSGVKKLGPGEILKLGTTGKDLTFNFSKWYSLPIFCSLNSSLNMSDAIVGSRLLLRQAVQRQLVADVSVGAFLSGGLDSSSVVAFAREQNPDIRCFTIECTGSSEEGIADDLPYARRVAAHLNVPLEIVRIDAARMAADLPAMVVQLDEPLADPAPLNVLYISRLAREQGIKVLLSGTGGDDLFTGYRRHRALMAEGLWSWLPRSARVGLEQLTCSLDQRRPLFRRLRKLFNGASLDGDARLVNYFRWVDRKDLAALYTPEFRVALGAARAEDPMLEFLADLPSGTNRLERLLALEQRFFLTDHNLTYTDKMSMAVGVEVRVPFLDLELVEFAARIPARFKQRGSCGKWVLKKAMEPYLPRDVIYRPKSGFGAPLRSWMRNELRDLLGDVLCSANLSSRGLFQPNAVHQLITDNHCGRVDASYTLLSLLCIELWCLYFIDGKPAPSFSS